MGLALNLSLERPPYQGHNTPMKKVTITQLKDNLSALLAQAASGEDIVIFSRKRPYVRLSSLFSYAADGNHALVDVSDRLVRLETDNLVRRRRTNSLLSVIQRKRPQAQASVVEALLADRADDDR